MFARERGWAILSRAVLILCLPVTLVELHLLRRAVRADQGRHAGAAEVPEKSFAAIIDSLGSISQRFADIAGSTGPASLSSGRSGSVPATDSAVVTAAPSAARVARQGFFDRHAGAIEGNADGAGALGDLQLRDQPILDVRVMTLPVVADLASDTIETHTRVRQSANLPGGRFSLARRAFLYQMRHRLGRRRQPAAAVHATAQAD